MHSQLKTQNKKNKSEKPGQVRNSRELLILILKKVLKAMVSITLH